MRIRTDDLRASCSTVAATRVTPRSAGAIDFMAERTRLVKAVRLCVL